MRFHISFFNSVNDNASDKESIPFVEMTWGKVCAIVSQPKTCKSKEEAGLWNGAKFGSVRYGGDDPKNKDSLRHVGNVIENNLLFFDYDDGETFAEAIAYWQDMQCAFVAHTSFSHTPEHHKFRVIVPLATPVPTAKYKPLWRALTAQDEVEGKQTVDRSPSSSASIFYVPAHPAHGEYIHYIGEGNFLDWTSLDLMEPAPTKPPPADYQPGATRPKRASAYLTPVMNSCLDKVAGAAARTGNITLRNYTMILAGYLHYGVYTEIEIEERMTAATGGWTKHKNIQSTIRRAIRDGSAKPLYIPDNPNWKPSRNGASVRAPRNQPSLETEEHLDWDEQVATINEEMEEETAPLFDENDLHKWTDAGMMLRFFERYGKNFRFIREREMWAAWTGEVWDMESAGSLLTNRIEETCRFYNHLETSPLVAEQAEIKSRLPADIATLPKTLITPEMVRDLKRLTEIEAALKAIRGFFKKYGGNACSRGLKSYASVSIQFDSSINQFDKLDWALNCQNGTLDLQTKTLSNFNRDDYLTQQLSVAYEPAAECPKWIAFLEKVVPDPAMRLYLQRAVGYTLTGSNREHCLFICYGNGSNGKSTFLETLEFILAPFHTKAATNTFSSSESIALAELARMRNSRFVTISENEEQSKLSEGIIKTATADKEITAKALYQNPFQYTPKFKIWLAVNHRPIIRGQDDGIWRRLTLLPFEVKITDKEKDKLLGDTLRAQEAPGILAWAVRGCLDWQVNGLKLPEVITQKIQSYREEMDTLGRWIEDKCETDPTYSDSSTDMYENYSDWAKRAGEYVLTMTMWGRKMGDRGYGVEKDPLTRRKNRIGIQRIYSKSP